MIFGKSIDFWLSYWRQQGIILLLRIYIYNGENDFLPLIIAAAQHNSSEFKYSSAKIAILYGENRGYTDTLEAAQHYSEFIQLSANSYVKQRKNRDILTVILEAYRQV